MGLSCQSTREIVSRCDKIRRATLLNVVCGGCFSSSCWSQSDSSVTAGYVTSWVHHSFDKCTNHTQQASYVAPNVHWIVPQICSALVGIANFAIYMATIDYMIAAYGPLAASATGSNGFCRDFLAGIAALYARPLYSNILPGTKWQMAIPCVDSDCCWGNPLYSSIRILLLRILVPQEKSLCPRVGA